MAKQQAHSEQHREQYQRARREFDELRTDEKAIFLIEAAVTTFARGLEEAGQAFARALDNLFQAPPPREEAPPPPPPV